MAGSSEIDWKNRVGMADRTLIYLVYPGADGGLSELGPSAETADDSANFSSILKSG